MSGFSIRRHTGKPSHGRWSHSIEHLKNEARKSIWFAFQTLLDTKGETVQTHTLKVLTASIGNALGIEKSEELHDQTELTELDFESYFKLIESVMFEPLSKASSETMDLSNMDYQEVHNVCWMLFYNHEKGKSIPEDVKEVIASNMWRMFNLFAEEDDSDTPILPIKIDPEEASIIFEAILSQTGNQSLLSKTVGALGEDPLSFQKYLGDFYLNIYKEVKEAVLKSSVDMVHEQFVYDILKKGNLSKRGHQVRSWKERYMVLTPTDLKYYVTSHQKHIKGVIVFEKSHTVEVLPDKGGKRNLFVLKTSQKPYEMSAMDLKTRNEWVAGIQTAIDHSDDPNYHHHKDLSKQRRKKRNVLRKEREEAERKRREEEENQRKLEDGYKQRELENEEMLRKKLQELNDAQKAKAELEELLKEQNALREAERQRLLELEASKAELEKLLELERQAKRDEETVRKLQAALLQEESEKREELEKLKREQEQLLQHERQMREGLEGQWEEKDKILADAQRKLSALEAERLEASEKLDKATERLQQAEVERLKMEEKVKLWKKPNVGLARPIQPTNPKLITHRGEGAFCAADFLKRSRRQDRKRGMTKEQLNEKYGEHIPDVSSDEEDAENGRLKSPVTKEASKDDKISTNNGDHEKSNEDSSQDHKTDAISNEENVNEHTSKHKTNNNNKPEENADIIRGPIAEVGTEKSPTRSSGQCYENVKCTNRDKKSELNKDTVKGCKTEKESANTEGRTIGKSLENDAIKNDNLEEADEETTQDNEQMNELNEKRHSTDDSTEENEQTCGESCEENQRKSLPSFNNEVYENISSDSYVKKPELTKKTKEEDPDQESPNTDDKAKDNSLENENDSLDQTYRDPTQDSKQIYYAPIEPKEKRQSTDDTTQQNELTYDEPYEDNQRKSSPSFDNDVYENVSSESYVEKPEQNQSAAPDVYDYVDLKKIHII